MKVCDMMPALLRLHMSNTDAETDIGTHIHRHADAQPYCCRKIHTDTLAYRHIDIHRQPRANKNLQHTVIHHNTLQHSTTHCNTLHETAIHCNTLQTTKH